MKKTFCDNCGEEINGHAGVFIDPRGGKQYRVVVEHSAGSVPFFRADICVGCIRFAALNLKLPERKST